jgi:hypothetical protein
MANTMEQQLQTYFTQLSEAEKKSVLQLIKTFVNAKKEVSERISIEQYNQELEEAEAEFKRGEYITHEEMRKQMKE